MAKEICEDCGKVFEGGANAFLCPECRKKRVEDGKKKAYANRNCPKKCLNCEYRKIITHYVVPYNFCTKLNVSFTKNEPDDFLNCTK